MAIKIGSNFTFQGEQPNFERDRFATKAAMKAFPETSIDDGHLSYCAEDGNTYQFKSSNSIDTVTGKWRIFKADVDLSAYATKDSVAIDLAKKVDIAGKNVYVGDGNVKVATIPVPIKAWQTVTATIDIRCRYSSYNVDISISSGETNNLITVKARKHSNNINKDTEKVYYYIDNSVENNYKVIIFYKSEGLDTVYGRIVAMSGQYTVLPTLNMEVAAELPEGAVAIMYAGYGEKNLFYATPKGAAGDPTFRSIDVTDIPDLSKKYQTVNTNGYQANPLMINAKIGADSNSGYKYLTALTYGLPDDVPYKESPDWYYATDGTLQDIKTKIPKITLDDAVSTTSTNGVENQAITKYVDGKVTTINSNITDLHSSLESTQTDFVDLRNKVNAMPKTVFITQADYNALTTKDANTIYYING